MLSTLTVPDVTTGFRAPVMASPSRALFLSGDAMASASPRRSAFALSPRDGSFSRSLPSPARVSFTPAEIADRLEFLNNQLGSMSPPQILEWCIDHIPGLYQTTAFGLTGCVGLDMISKISQKKAAAGGKSGHLVDVIFIDTLYHFEETLQLAKKATDKVGAKMHIYKPPGADSVQEFERCIGEKLWETDEDSYDFLVKVEPARRAYEELNVKAIITGRRRSQGGARAAIPILEVDETGLIKVNPLAAWTLENTMSYIKREGVPYNALVDQGYKSIGDWHSTATPAGVESAAGERGGRWKGTGKTECGLHKDYFQMKAAFEQKQKEMAESSSRL